MSGAGVARMSTEYGLDCFDGEERPRLVIAGDYVLSGRHQGGVHVESGQFLLAGILQGSLDVQTGVTAFIRGTLQGSVRVADGGNVVVTGGIEGSAHVEPGGSLCVESGGKLAGSLTNYGDVIVRGVFGGTARGGRIRLEGAGYIKEPVVRDGASHYEW